MIKNLASTAQVANEKVVKKSVSLSACAGMLPAAMFAIDILIKSEISFKNM